MNAPPAVTNPACAPTSAPAIEAQIHALYIKNAWPDENSALGKFRSVQNTLQSGDLNGARTQTRNLVLFVQNKFNHLSAAQQAAAKSDYDKLIVDLYCYVGMSGLVFDLNPGDPVRTFEIPGVGGVQFPANAVPVGTFVTLTDLSGGASPLVTPLDTYSSYLSIDLYPPAVLPQPATVVLCSQPPAPPSVLVGHQDPTTGFEILDPAPVPVELQGTCGTTTGLRPGMSPIRRMLARIADAILPSRLEAAPSTFMFLGGIGGLTSKFSPFGLVDPKLSGSDGIGSRTSGFAPRALPDAAPVNNPPLPASYLSGGVGGSTTTGLPTVSVKTQGFDVDGVNPIADVTVIFSTGPSSQYDPDSQAKVCRVETTTDGNGNPVSTVVPKDTVQVKTDAEGNATLPCLIYGNVAGFANLSATFDPTTLSFANSDLVTVASVDGTSEGSTLNWLVKSDAGVPAQLGFATSPSTTGAAGVPLSQQPALQLLDSFGNEVYVAGVAVTAAVTSGGGTATHSPVTTDLNGVATFTDLAIGGKVAGTPQTVSFSFTGIGSVLTSTVTVTAGAATSIATWFPPAAPAPSFDYGTGLSSGSPVSPSPEVLVTDVYGNPVGSQPVFWTATTSNGGVLDLTAGTTTGADGGAQVTSWTLGDGFNQAVASIYGPTATPPAGYQAAEFLAAAPTGVSVFACGPGNSKTDLAPFSIKPPNANVRTVTLSMSVTGQSSRTSAYPATLRVFKNGPTGAQIGLGAGTVELPGDNGNPVPVTFRLSDQVTKADGQGVSVLWFQLTVTAPANRKVQLWYKSGTFKSNDPCANARVYTPGYPAVTTSKQGLAVTLTN